MNLLYRLESSERVRSITVDVNTIDLSLVIDIILKNMFKDKDPSCTLELINSTDTILKSNNSIPYVFKRTYRNKFVMQPVVKKKQKQKRKRRWRSPPVRKRRWRSRSPLRR